MTTKIIETVLVLDLFGFSLGDYRADILKISFNQSDCTSILHYSSEHVRCYLILNQPQQFDENLVEIYTIYGNSQGISLDATSVVNSGSLMPVLQQIVVTEMPFQPYSLAFVSSGVAGEGVLYWTNVASEGFAVQRAFANGSHLETLLNNVDQGRGLAVMTAFLDQNLSVLPDQIAAEIMYLNSSGLCPPTSTSFSYQFLQQLQAQQGVVNACDVVLRGHVVFVSDAATAQIIRVAVLPIQDNLIVFDWISPAASQFLGRTSYLNAAMVQESNNVLYNVLNIAIIAKDMNNLHSLTIDLDRRGLYIACREGLVVRMNLDEALVRQVSP